jgi:hypothetical protein
MDSAPEDVPDEVVSQAKAAFARRSRGQIAVLVWDSLVDDDQPGRDHKLQFEHPDLQIDVHIHATDHSSDLHGQVKPPDRPQVDLQSDEGKVLRTAQTFGGTFTFAEVPSGIVRLCIGGPATPDVCTDWFRL